jgi:hypothetical protein
VKLRQLLKRFDLWLRPAHVHGDYGEDDRPLDNLDAMTTTAGGFEGFNAGAAGHADTPPNWVPSQQDRPRH